MAKEITPLSVMTGSGSSFSAAGKTYKIRPMTLKETVEFGEAHISIGAQLFNMVNEEAKKGLDKFLKACIADENGKPVSLKRAIDDNWDLADLQTAVELICKLGG